jgi:hypothetical protein
MDTINKETARPKKTSPRLQRETFHTSRLLDFCNEKELTAQTGHPPAEWPLVVVKELVDNALDACEEAGIAPCIVIAVDNTGITVADNGPGMPAETVKGILDYKVRVSSREAYVSPTRGAQGNAMKTIVAMPYVLDGESGRVDIAAAGVCHRINFAVDQVRQEPVIEYDPVPWHGETGTSVLVHWPLSPRSELDDAKARFLQIADDFAWLNPHLTLTVDWFGEGKTVEATAPAWEKWRPSDPTSAHWYEPEHLERLVGAYLTSDQAKGR